MRIRAFGFAIAVAACGPSDPDSLEELDITRLGLTIDFDADKPDEPQLVTALTYRHDGDECPSLDISADLDGVDLAASPGGTGRVGEGCQLGFVLLKAPPPTAAESAVRFRDERSDASIAVARLLEPRFLVPPPPEETVVGAGDVIELIWPVDTDAIVHLDGVFERGAEETEVEPGHVGDQVAVTVPPVAPGSWTLSLSVLAKARILGCDRATECRASVLGEGALPITVE